MKKIEYYIDYIFEENQEDIKQYILKQTDTINFKINKNNISNDKTIYSKIVEKSLLVEGKIPKNYNSCHKNRFHTLYI